MLRETLSTATTASAVAEDLGDSVQNHHGPGAVTEAWVYQFTHQFIQLYVVVGALKGIIAGTQRTVGLS